MRLTKDRSFENYISDRMANLSQRTQEGELSVLKRFDDFCNMTWKKSRDEIIKHVKLIQNDDEKEDETISILQEWVNHMSRNDNVGSDAIKVYVSNINKYLKYFRIRIDTKEIQYPENFLEEKYAISISEIHSILKSIKWKKQGYHLSLISSGARPIEICGLRKKDYFWTGKRWGALIPSHLTKKKMARSVFFSVECNPYIGPQLKKIENDDFVWSKQKTIPEKILKKYNKHKDSHKRATKHYADTARRNQSTLMADTVEKIGLGMKYETTGFHKINLYCYRGYFFTRALRIFGDDVAHAMIGHGAYLTNYQRRTNEEKEELYDELESELLIYDQTKNQQKIKKLQEANTRISDLEEANRDKDKRLSRLENALMSTKLQKSQ